jgi:hypothetical protein
MASLFSSAALPVGLLGRQSFGGLLALLLFFGGLSAPADLMAQRPSEDSVSLAERYRTARFRSLAQEYLTGRRTIPIQPVRPLPTRADSLFSSSGDDTTDARETPSSFPIDKVRRVRDLERSWFRNRYREVQWSFLGPGTYLTFADTVRTRDLRARLQARFGNPTRTLAEIYSNEWVATPDSVREDPVQFEYWFVVNDSIPVRVSDANGPGGRGVIISTDRRRREQLSALRASLLEPLREERPAPYVDYYYESSTERWYRVGFDGATFFRERISRFDIVPGRRPTLDTTETDSSDVRRGEYPRPSDP